MTYDRSRSYGFRNAMVPASAGLGLSVLAGGAVALVAAGAVPASASAQQSATPATSLVFEGVTVVDVEQGKLLPAQRVVIVGNRIQAVGSSGATSVPRGAQVVDAKGKYLIPGLWELHTHFRLYPEFFYPLFIAHGVTGIREPGGELSLDTLVQWRREILAGTRVGPPRQILSGQGIDERSGCRRSPATSMGHHCVTAGDTADVRKLVDSLKAAGANMIKTYGLSKEMYFMIAAESRRVGVPFGGHISDRGLSAAEASDSGASILDHVNSAGGLNSLCIGPQASVEQCQPIADRLRRNNTWLVPTITRFMTHGWGQRAGMGPRAQSVFTRFVERTNAFWAGSIPRGNWLHASTGVGALPTPDERASANGDTLWGMSVARRVGLPMVAGSDAGSPVMRKMPPGFALHGELALYVAEGLTPLEALRTATFNPARMLRGTDSLGTVASGKLADLVLLDADPLADITNTTTVRAVVANGRYFDRAALDSLLTEVQAKAKQEPEPFGQIRMQQ